MINIFLNFGYALLALAVITIILHFLLVYPRNLSKTQWKKVDYLWIALTAFGLIGSTNSVRVMYNKNQISLYDHSIPFQYHYLRSFLTPDGSKAVCLEYVRDRLSPPDFDSIVADQTRSCEWSKKMYQLTLVVDTFNYAAIDTAKIPTLRTKDNVWFRDMLISIIYEYNKQVKEKAVLQDGLTGETATMVLFYTPLLLIIGLAIRITKVSGELRHEIQTKKSGGSVDIRTGRNQESK
jgi:hypothetical protein